MADMQDSIDAVYSEIPKAALHKDDISKPLQTKAYTSQETALAYEEVRASKDDQLCAILSVTTAREILTGLNKN